MHCPSLTDSQDEKNSLIETVERSTEERRHPFPRSRLHKEQTRLSRPSLMTHRSIATSNQCWDRKSLPPQLSEDHIEPSLDFFFSTYARPSAYNKFEHRGFLEHVFELYTMAAPDSSLRLSTMAVGTFLLASWMDRRHDSYSSTKYYGKAISAMREQVSSISTCANDEMLVSILLLQLYESLVGFVKSEKESRAHLDGALAVIKHRGFQKFDSETSHGLLLSVRMQVCDLALRIKQPIPSEMLGWSGVRPESDSLPRNKLEAIRLHIANLQAMVPSHRHANPSIHDKNMSQIINRAAMIEQMLASWYANLPLAWYPTRISTTNDFPQSIITAGLYKQLCDVYPSISVASTFNRYRFSLLRIKTVTINCVAQQTRSLTTMNKQAHTLNQMQLLSDDICASVPFHLGDRVEAGWLGDKRVCYPCLTGQELPVGQHEMAQSIGGWHLLDPLKELIIMKVKLRTGQREWVGRQLMRIATIYNIGR